MRVAIRLGALVRIAAALFAAWMPVTAHAMRVSPMVVEMKSSGTGAVARIEVQNVNQADLPFETRITRIDFDDNGNMIETPADQDFLVFPPQGLLKSGQRQVIRLQWLGGADLPTSRGYYVSINQLPVQFTSEPGKVGANVQLVYNMKVLATVAPPKAVPKISVVSVKPIMIVPETKPGTPAPAAADMAPKPGLEVVVRNTGKRYAMMAGAKWTIKGKDKAGKPVTLVLGPEALNRTVGVGYVAPVKGMRTFRVPTEVEFGPGPIAVEFSN
jgi:fimbrial chaperone protein